MKKALTKSLIILSVIILFSNLSYSQISFNADIYSRYNWRGMDFGDAPSFQPYVTFTTGGFSLGYWGAYAWAGPSGGVYSEADLWASYAVATEAAGTFSVIYTDYFFPYAGLKYSNYKGNGDGAHTLEGGISYSGPESFPVTIAGYYNLHNDPDKSTYFQVGYPFTVGDVGVNVFAGASGGKSAGYGTDKFAFINTGLTFTKTITVTEKFSIPATASLIYNPNISQLYLIFGITI